MSNPIEIVNCEIESTSLMVEDHGILTAFLHLAGPGWGQGFGGYTLDTANPDIRGARLGHPFGSAFIRGVLDTLEVGRWEQLPGTRLRARRTHSKVHAIGHFMKDQWFDPAEVAQRYTKETP